MNNDTDKKYLRSHIGEVYTTKDGYECKIIDGGSRDSYCTIQIENWTTEYQFSAIKRGQIKYPYHPSVYNTGYIGEGKYNAYSEEYKVWRGMIARCYDPKTQKIQPTYIGTIVCKEWHNFQVFAKWYHTQYKEKSWQLDKDLLSDKENKKYSPQTCIVIPRELNSFLAAIQGKKGSTGVVWHKRDKLWQAAIRTEGKIKYLGCYKNKQIAIMQYKLARKKEANKWKKEMTGILPQRALNSIK